MTKPIGFKPKKALPTKRCPSCNKTVVAAYYMQHRKSGQCDRTVHVQPKAYAQWSAEDDSLLINLREVDEAKWQPIADTMARSYYAVVNRYKHLRPTGRIVTPSNWTKTEMAKLKTLVEGSRPRKTDWNAIGQAIGRTAVACTAMASTEKYKPLARASTASTSGGRSASTSGGASTSTSTATTKSKADTWKRRERDDSDDDFVVGDDVIEYESDSDDCIIVE